MVLIRHWFMLIRVDQILPRCNVYQTMAEWHGQHHSMLFDACSAWINTRLIINQHFGWTQSLWTVLIVNLHWFTLTSCLMLNRPNSGLNRRKSTFGHDRDRLGSIGRRSASIRRRSASICVDQNWFGDY